jgi:hypothetical protein
VTSSDEQGRDHSLLRDAKGVRASQAGLQATARFTRRPRALPARQRLTYRTGLVVLTLDHCRQKAIRLDNLHLLSWAMRSRRTRAMFGAWWSGRRFTGTFTQRLDPELELSLNLLMADRLVQFTNVAGRRVGLTDSGKALAAELRNEDVYDTEKAFLATFDELNDAAISRRMATQ